MKDTEKLVGLYRRYFDSDPIAVETIPLSGSNRRYYRLRSDGGSCIGTISDVIAENEAFIYLTENFTAKGLPVPEIYDVADDRTCYLQSDLGSQSLFDIISAEGVTPRVVTLMEQCMERLADMQYAGIQDLDLSKCYPSPEMDSRSVMWDLNYFKYCFLKTVGVEFSEPRLEDDFERLAADLMNTPRTVFIYRDFQSRNVMVVDGRPKFIDYQGGRLGSPHYDLASFLWQARAGYTEALREDLIAKYLQYREERYGIHAEDFRRRLDLFVLFRLLQVLGAYGYRGNFERKAHFIASIPKALANLERLLDSCRFPYPYLESVLREVIRKSISEPTSAPNGLTVSVVSFAFKNGYPVDASGNGGGFVFDCRALHNPGRYDEYKPLTGMDAPVIQFLDRYDDVAAFMEHAYALVDAAVERYLARGFTSLMVCFGCTGGRHRSVYGAEHMAAHLIERFDVTVKLTHREQNISKTIKR